MTNETTLRDKATIYLRNQQEVHISKHNKRFNNGYIKHIDDKFLILIDRKEGEIPVFFIEIYEIERAKPEVKL